LFISWFFVGSWFEFWTLGNCSHSIHSWPILRHSTSTMVSCSPGPTLKKTVLHIPSNRRTKSTLVSVWQMIIFWICFKLNKLVEISVPICCFGRRLKESLWGHKGVCLSTGIKFYGSLAHKTEGHWEEK
jgi:hypothetical protein